MVKLVIQFNRRWMDVYFCNWKLFLLLQIYFLHMLVTVQELLSISVDSNWLLGDHDLLDRSMLQPIGKVAVHNRCIHCCIHCCSQLTGHLRWSSLLRIGIALMASHPMLPSAISFRSSSRCRYQAASPLCVWQAPCTFFSSCLMIISKRFWKGEYME